VIAWRAFLQSLWGDGQTTLALCQRALSLLSAENAMARLPVAAAQVQGFGVYPIVLNN